ncbi:MAG: prohibitin family protein [Salibacteraceae bacterium]
MKALKILPAVLLGGLMATSCAVIKPGEVGVKQRLGKLDSKVMAQGAHAYNPFVTRVVVTPVRTVNLEVALNLPSKEGLNISSNISILYRIEQEMVPTLIRDVGLNYEQIIRSVFRSSSADICAKFMAKDMHSGRRSEIEDQIADRMNTLLKERGITIEAVLMKSIQLPAGLYDSIEARLQAEQEALRMQFVLEQEKREAERKVIEAKGDRDAQQILSEGLTKEILELRSIEAFLKLAESNGSKVIITNGESPFIIQSQP